jgi:hypothetical protein
MMVEMMDKAGAGEGGEDAVVERVIGAHLSGALEGQRGRALLAFREAVREGRAEQVSAAVAMGDGEAARTRRAMWVWGGLPTALAACVAVAVGLQAFLGAPAGGVRPNKIVNVAPAAMEENVWTRDVDGGMVVGERGPMQVRRQQVVRQRRWVDPRDGAVYSVTEPGEKVGYEAVRAF